MKGTLTRVEWQNPHVMFYVDVVKSTGSREAWIVEGDAPAVLTTRGWTRDTLKQGDAATLSGFRPTTRNARLVGGATIELRDGRRLLFGENLPRWRPRREFLPHAVPSNLRADNGREVIV
jgi:hypothetical protein